MMTAEIPRDVLMDIQKMQRSSIWGKIYNYQKYQVNWSIVTQPKHIGGLEVRRLHVMNFSCILKLGWSLYNNGAHTLWGDVLKGAEYMRCVSVKEDCITKGHDSSLWKALSITYNDLVDFPIAE